MKINLNYRRKKLCSATLKFFMLLTLCRCHIKGTIRLNETRPLLEQFYARGAFRLQWRVNYQQPGSQFYTFAAGSTAWWPIGPVRHLKSSSSNVVNYRIMNFYFAVCRFWTPHPAHRIKLLFRSCLTRWFHAFLLLNERHKRTPFTTAAITESPRSHFQTDPACIGTLGPLAPFGSLAKRVALQRNHIVIALLLAPEITHRHLTALCKELNLICDYL